jgi:hypothetical protein
MTIDSGIDLELANREDELSEDKLNAVAGGWPGASLGLTSPTTRNPYEYVLISQTSILD